MKRLFTQFSFPGGIPSHVAPETPGSIHEGGELGYCLLPRLRRRVRQSRPDRRLRGRRWRSRNRPARHELALEQVPQPGTRRRGTADPASQWLQDRQSDRAGAHSARQSWTSCCAATATSPISSRATSPQRCIELMAATLDKVFRARSAASSSEARASRLRAAAALADDRARARPRAGPAPRCVDGLQIEGTFRAHQVPLADPRAIPSICSMLEAWMKSYRAGRAFRRERPPAARARGAGARGRTANGRQPARQRRALLLRDLRMPDFRDYAVDVARPGRARQRKHARLGQLLRDVMKPNAEPRNFRIVRSGRNHLQPARRACSKSPTGVRWRRLSPIDDHVWRPTGG